MGRARGFTLVELMVVVAIIGILAGIAVFIFSKTVGDAHASEVHEVFAQISLKQEQYQGENGTYLSLSADETDTCCGATKNSYGSLSAAPAAYLQLKLDFGRSELKCNYAVVAGVADDDTDIGAIGASMFPSAPPTNWWYGVAHCPSNGKTYITNHGESRVIAY